MPDVKQTFRFLLLFLFVFLTAASTLYAQVGGGYTAGGLQGEYFANGTLSGTPAFTRREVRLDFDWGTMSPVGGSNDPRYGTFPHDSFSARYTGQVVATFSQTYTFKTIADDGVRLLIRPEGSGVWSTLIDAWGAPATSSGTATLVAGQRYDLKVEYRQLTGAALLRLLWSSPGTPEEVIDPVVDAGINVTNWVQGFADIVKCARNSWQQNGNGAVVTDLNGWPTNDASLVIQESMNSGLDLDPLMTGTIAFSFTGKADVDVTSGNLDRASLTYSYDAATNSSSGSFSTQLKHWNASYFAFTNSDRDGRSPPRKNGITNLRLMRPRTPGGVIGYPSDVVFNDQFRTAYSKFTSLRVNLNNGNVERFWSDRTLPGYFNQAGGSTTVNAYPPNGGPNNTPAPSDNGASWEHKIMLANETGADLYLNLPLMVTGWSPADTTSYVYKLALLLRYGSDGVEPYSAPTVNPVYPPLNPNLRLYLELSNELWNTMSFAFRQSFDLITLATLDADAALGSATALADPLARPMDFPTINYDGLSTAKDAGGYYLPINIWNKRKQMLRTIQISNIFRSVWGDAALPSRIRPIYEWQYDNANNTASIPLAFANDWFNNGDGVAHVATPHPANYFIWGGGGASYYGAVNGYGVTDLLPDSGFESPVESIGYTPNPVGAPWTFQGTAGIARASDGSDGIPPAFEGGQMGYIAGSGSMSVQVQIPQSQSSNSYAFVFKALQRVKPGAPLDGNGKPVPDSQKLRLFINDVESNWGSFNQSGGYQPLPYDSGNPWNCLVVYWASSTPYYSSTPFTGTPGEIVTLRIQGSAAADQIAFLEDVRLGSMDQLFADGFPGGGEAAGQPAGSGYQNNLNSQSSWAHAFGLHYITYEGGWSLGGDTGGTPLQNLAKFRSAGTVEVNKRAIDMFHKAGGSLNSYGTYSQWPGWSDAIAEEGMLDVTKYPLMISWADRMNNLPSEAANGVFLPNVLDPSNASLKESVDVSGSVTGRGWLSWNAISSTTATYTISVATSIGGTVQLSLDGASLGVSFASGGITTRTAVLTKGMHGVRLDGAGGSFTLQQVTVAIPGATDLPTITSVTDASGSLTVQWAPVDGATGYIVRWGTVPGVYDFSAVTGVTTRYVISGLKHDCSYYVTVVANNGVGLSLPAAAVGRTALVDGLSGHLARWDFAGDTGTSTSHPPTAGTSRLNIGNLVLGSGLIKSDYGVSYTAESFAYQQGSNVPDGSSLTLEGALASGQYTETTLTPLPGTAVSIDSVTFAPYWQNTASVGGVAWSVDGGPFTIAAVTGTPSVSTGKPLSADVTAVPQLQGVSGTIRFRLLHAGLTRYEFAGIGRYSGDDIVVMGRVNTIYTVNTTPAGRTLIVDGTSCTAPQSFAWIPGSSHTIATVAMQNGNSGTRYLFSSWSDGGGMSHTVTAPTTGATYTANFGTQYQLTSSVIPAGTASISWSLNGISQPTNWFTAGTQVAVKAFPTSPNIFSAWSGDASGSVNPVTVTMNAPLNVIAVTTIPAVSPVLTPAAGIVKSGAAPNRTWSFTLTNNSTVAAGNVRLALTLTPAPSCTPLFAPAPVSLGTIAAGGGSAIGNVTINFNNCQAATKFTAKYSYTFTGSPTVVPSKSFANQFQ